MISTDKKHITDLLTRGVEDLFVKEHLETALLSGKQLRVKFGIDPTGPKLHLGRAVGLRKLKAFQDLGHQVVIIVGDFTAQIGDASDKTEKRPMLSREMVNENFKDYKEQISKILDISKVEFVYNSDWLDKLGFQEITQLAECFSVQQMSARRNFKDRLERGDEISLREFLYPLMQGYDSVAIKADVEIGGFDQLFNLKAGRVIQKHFDMPEQDVLTVQMLEGTDGRKMSTSWGNIVTIVDEPSDMYGKIMALHDELIVKYFTLCTDVSTEEIEIITKELETGINPRDLKMRLAREIVKMYHSEELAVHAEQDFVSKFQKKEIPDELEKISISEGSTLVEVLLEKGMIDSKTAWRRLVEDGAVTNLETKEKITDIDFVPQGKTLIKIGKKIFIECVID
ncbi:tyrosine--tRNA ligase [Candidatus Nomurabacteria bacterium]|nr:tyrosine--tRNA ligase [Candidatus Nomurabacteria bacterium]